MQVELLHLSVYKIHTLSLVYALTNMMKLYQFKLLLFLLLNIVNATLSISFPAFSPGIVKPLESKWLKRLEKFKKGLEATDPLWSNEIIQDKVEDYKEKKMWDKIKLPPPSQLPSSPPSQLPKHVQGLDHIKQYLHDFGYLEQSGPFNNTPDQETLLAIKTYVQYFNIQAFDQLLPHIALPRCGVPDMNLKYGFTNDIPFSYPKGNQWFPKGTKNLTYCFAPENEIPLNMTNVLRNALTRWSNTTRVLNFTETKSYHDANIKILFYNMTYGDGIDDVVVGGTLIGLDSANLTSGLILLDATKYWALPTEDGGLDLETAAMHQIGHLLGLEHSSDNKSIMYPTILPSQRRKVQITDSDNLAIQKLYVSTLKANASSDDSSGCVKLFGSSSSLFISLSIVFAFVAVLY